MSSRTTTSIVTFLHPFVVAGHAKELPAGEYEVLAEDEAVLTQSFAAYRRLSTFLRIELYAGRTELWSVNHEELELALEQDQANALSNIIKNSAAALSPSEEQI